MDLREEEKSSTRLNAPMVVLVAGVAALVALTVTVALWRYGAFLPGWINWKADSLKVDTNGNDQIETVILSNRHLTITNSAGDHYITPNNWLVTDISVGDMNIDGTPEVVALLWVLKSGSGAYRFPVLDFIPGYTEYIYVFDYEGDEIKPLWHTTPLEDPVVGLHVYDLGELAVYTADGRELHWQWVDPGFSHIDEAGK